MSATTLARQARRLNLPLMLVTDDSDRDWRGAAKALPRGSLVLVRARDAKARAERLESLRDLPHLRLLVADDPALAMTADGLHLPQARAKEAMHWRARRPDWLITASAHDLHALTGLGPVDAVLLSPVFPTASHPGAPALGPLRAAFIAAAAPVPVYALGGVTAQSARRLAPSFAGIAAIGALTG